MTPTTSSSAKRASVSRPTPTLLTATALLMALLLAGCGGKPGDEGSSTGSAAASKYDAGPRAFESAVDEDLAEKGEKIFMDKGCSACHAFGRKLSGPDLAGVTQRRTAQWIEHQILNPEAMVKEDPIARQLMAQHALQMPNQGLTPEQARAVIEFLKYKDKEAGE